MTDNYNGWYDWDTWNCALWLGNTHTLTIIAEKSISYDDFLAKLKAFAGDADLAECTPDGARWADADYSEMNELICDLRIDSIETEEDELAFFDEAEEEAAME